MANPVVHFEIGSRDSGKAAEFYTSMFGWSTQAMGPATMIQTGSKEGIQGHISMLGHEPFHYTIFYVQVESIEDSLLKAESLGGKTVVPKVDIPMGSFAWFADPDGNTVGLWKPSAPVQ
jgi:predicted enzyme related to lactoylglutathione lyase